MNPNELDILKIYKQKVIEAFYPKRGFGFKLADGKKAISDFRKLKLSDESLIDLMLCYVETGVKFTNEYGDINESFYASLESVYENCLKLVVKKGHLNDFKGRAYEIVKDSKGTGWGFHDQLSITFEEFYI